MEDMEKIVTFGEIMLRLTPNGNYRFFQNDQRLAAEKLIRQYHLQIMGLK